MLSGYTLPLPGLSDKEWAAYLQGIAIIGTGYGIPRKPQRKTVGGVKPKYSDRAPFVTLATTRSFVETVGPYGSEASYSATVLVDRIRRVDYPHVTDDELLETDMAAYRYLAREITTLQAKSRLYVQGHTFEPHRPSPFGMSRFRTFDPAPAFSDRCGFVQFHAYS